ncbi:MAG: ATP-binding cassette domain-containing protein [Deltaproteobacteria bacterium]|nr:MAG: ATP-binding cassette domain-containing protein [Deltaproteobacteria bacterium]
MATVGFQALHKRYGDTHVLKGIEAQVEDGEYVVLVGPSGCGKSTLLRCVAGLEEISEGQLTIGDRVVNSLAPAERDVAMVFQSYALYPHMTVAENMGFALRVAGRPREEIQARVAEVARMLELEPLLERLPAQMSGGQRQRVAMGRAIVRQPAVFLFDEPLSNLDASLRTHMRVELKRLHQRLGATILHVTHDQVEALTLADRILVLNQGIVQQFGSPRELYDTPANTFVATFIGSPSMNMLRGLPGEEAIVGVRPHDVVLGSGEISATVDVVESLGAEALVHLQLTDGTPMVAQVPEPASVKPGDAVNLAFAKVHRFDPSTERRL